jgi:hypothetical protein
LVVIVMKVSQIKSVDLFPGGTRTAALVIFATPFTTSAIATAAFISRVFGGAQPEDQSDPQVRLETYRGLIMKVIEACVLYPAILLNLLRMFPQIDSEQNAVREPQINIREPLLLTSAASSLTIHTKVITQSPFSFGTCLTFYQPRRSFSPLGGLRSGSVAVDLREQKPPRGRPLLSSLRVTVIQELEMHISGSFWNAPPAHSIHSQAVMTWKWLLWQ